MCLNSLEKKDDFITMFLWWWRRWSPHPQQLHQFRHFMAALLQCKELLLWLILFSSFHLGENT
jgi:hypothetical protein